MTNLKDKALNFLYRWVNENKISHLRKGMVEDLENFVTEHLAQAESNRAAERMMAAQQALKPQETEDETNS